MSSQYDFLSVSYLLFLTGIDKLGRRQILCLSFLRQCIKYNETLLSKKNIGK